MPERAAKLPTQRAEVVRHGEARGAQPPAAPASVASTAGHADALKSGPTAAPGGQLRRAQRAERAMLKLTLQKRKGAAARAASAGVEAAAVAKQVEPAADPAAAEQPPELPSPPATAPAPAPSQADPDTAAASRRHPADASRAVSGPRATATAREAVHGPAAGLSAEAAVAGTSPPHARAEGEADVVVVGHKTSLSSLMSPTSVHMAGKQPTAGRIISAAEANNVGAAPQWPWMTRAEPYHAASSPALKRKRLSSCEHSAPAEGRAHQFAARAQSPAAAATPRPAVQPPPGAECRRGTRLATMSREGSRSSLELAGEAAWGPGSGSRLASDEEALPATEAQGMQAMREQERRQRAEHLGHWRRNHCVESRVLSERAVSYLQTFRNTNQARLWHTQSMHFPRRGAHLVGGSFCWRRCCLRKVSPAPAVASHQCS